MLSAGDAARQGGVKVSFFGGLTIGRVAEPARALHGGALNPPTARGAPTGTVE